MATDDPKGPFTVACSNRMLGQLTFCGVYQTVAEAVERARYQNGQTRTFCTHEVWTGTAHLPRKKVAACACDAILERVMVNARPVYVCPVCNLADDGWTLRNEWRGIRSFDCECGALHTIQPDGGCDTVTPRRRRSAERDYRAQVDSVRCPLDSAD
jgi:hypothetical protein